MALATSLIPGLDELVRGDDPERRAEAARRISDLFLDGASRFKPEHVEFFDGILIGLVPRTELNVRAGIAERLAVVANAPRNLVGQLAREDEIVIAGPLLRSSPSSTRRCSSRSHARKGRSTCSPWRSARRFQPV